MACSYAATVLLALALLCGYSLAVGDIQFENEGTLVFSHLLWRHGDRTPAAFSPNDPYQNASNWPVPEGELTVTGMQQHHTNGQWLRQRYAGFLPDAYSPNDIYVHSTDFDRTFASAYCNMAGLYPPAGDQIWNPNILWQPIPVHSVPAAYDYIIGAEIPSNCKAYQTLFNNLNNEPALREVIDKYQQLVNYVEINAGYPLSNNTVQELNVMVLEHDTLFVEALYNKPLPEWTAYLQSNQSLAFDTLALQFYMMPAYTPELATFRVGYFLQDILDRSTQKANGTIAQKVWAYSAHDINISTVLFGMNMFDYEFVQYAAMLLFELYQKDDGLFYLSIAYRRHYNDLEAERLEIPHCGYQCELSKMYKLYANILPTMPYAEACNV